MMKSLMIAAAITSLTAACSSSDFSAKDGIDKQEGRDLTGEPDGDGSIASNKDGADAGDAGDDGNDDLPGSDDLGGADDLTGVDPTDDDNYPGCRFFDENQAGKQSVTVKFPMPLVIDPRLGPNPVEATSVPHAGAAAFLSGGPKVDLTDYTLTDKGEWDGDDYRFSTTYYKDAGAVIGTILGGSQDWKIEVTFGPRLVEAEYLVTIKDAKSKRCKAVVKSIPVTRGDIVGSPSGCFDPKTKLKMADGTSRSINLIKTGDRVFNPLTSKSYKVTRVIFGPEKDLGMFEVGTGAKSLVIVTRDHPFMTTHGLKQAHELTLSDKIVTAGNASSPVTHLKQRLPNVDQRVYNLSLDAPEDDLTAHIVEANGVVTGDLVLQESLVKDRQKVTKLAGKN